MIPAAVLLEFEGVVADTFRARRDALASALATEGIILSDDEYLGLCAGWPNAAAVRAVAQRRKRVLDETTLELLAHAADKACSAHVGKGVVLVDGARPTLERLAVHTRLGVVSRLRRSDLDALIAMAKLDHVFSFVIGAEDATPGKPDPRPYAVALARLRRLHPDTSARSCLALEDGIAGIRAAHAAGLRCLAVGTLPAHVALEADGWLPSIAGLDMSALESLLSGHDG
jgi:HAD superfamily hydrolase (TIGR01509 family)